MDDGTKLHLAGIAQWLAGHSANTRLAQGLSGDERKQLHAVNKSIQQLSGLGVAIPDELRLLKLHLSARDVASPLGGPPERIADVAELVSALGKLAQTAKTLHNQLMTPGKEPVARQRYDATLAQLIQSGYLSTDDRLEFSWQKDGPVFEGKVLAGGELTAKTPSGWKQFDSLSAAADAIGERSLNGWLHWRRVNADGSRTSLKEIRARFLNEGGAQ